ncbi:VAMP-like protein YKT61 [Tanacetum coccineum]
MSETNQSNPSAPEKPTEAILQQPYTTPNHDSETHKGGSSSEQNTHKPTTPITHGFLTEKEYQQLLQDEEVLRETLEEQARAEKENGLCVVGFMDDHYPVRSAFSVLNQVIDEYQKKHGDSWKTVQADKTDQWPYLNDALARFQNPAEADKLLKIQRELDETKIILHKTIDSVLERGEKLDSLVEKSSDLSAASQLDVISISVTSFGASRLKLPYPLEKSKELRATREDSSPLALLSNPSISAIHFPIIGGAIVSRWIKCGHSRIAKLSFLDVTACACFVRESSVNTHSSCASSHPTWHSSSGLDQSELLMMAGTSSNRERVSRVQTGRRTICKLICSKDEEEYGSFVQNYNMHGMRKTVNELHVMLKLHEQTLPKKDAHALHAIRAGKKDVPSLHAIRAGKVQKKNKNKKMQLAARGNNQGKKKPLEVELSSISIRVAKEQEAISRS